jgi:hypothetical protein
MKTAPTCAPTCVAFPKMMPSGAASPLAFAANVLSWPPLSVWNDVIPTRIACARTAGVGTALGVAVGAGVEVGGAVGTCVGVDVG